MIAGGARSGVSNHSRAPRRPATWPADRRIVYVIDMSLSSGDDGVVIQLCAERLRKDGHWDSSKPITATLDKWMSVPSAADRMIIQMLSGA